MQWAGDVLQGPAASLPSIDDEVGSPLASSCEFGVLSGVESRAGSTRGRPLFRPSSRVQAWTMRGSEGQWGAVRGGRGRWVLVRAAIKQLS